MYSVLADWYYFSVCVSDVLPMLFLQRIPKKIASALNIEESGKANLIYGYEWEHHEASYYTCKDGRICFRDGWLQFANHFNLSAGSDVLNLFFVDNADRLCVSFDCL